MTQREPRLALSFDDVLLVPHKSDIVPSNVDVSTRLTKRIRLNIPLVSAAMDTVTEASLAIALAREGGLGVIHKNLEINDQAVEVDRVKRSESGMIIDPVTLGPNARIGEAEQIMGKFHISGLPITEGNRLVGILTNRDLRFETDMSKLVRDAMTHEGLVTTGEGTTLEEAKAILHEHRIEKLPVVNDEFELLGLITIKDIEKVAKYPHACKDSLGRLRVGAAIGVGDDGMERAAALVERGVDVLVVDSAHGHSANVITMVEKLKQAYPDTDIIGGNVATEAGTRDLVAAGVDAVKVGLGPGSSCTTRVISGSGVPQITAIADAAKAAAQAGIPVVADGGIKFSGDVAKAIAAGADSVMIGALFAGTEESPGERVLYRGRTYKVYRGMGSLAAMKERKSMRDRYMQQDVADEKLVPEGLEGRVPYKGPLSAVVVQLVGGLRSGMGYCGVDTIDRLRKDTEFYRISAAGLRESHPHDIAITEEAPNYQIPD